MRFKEKKIYLLNKLYNHRFEGKTFEVRELLHDLDCNREEAFQLAKALEEEGLIRLTSKKAGHFANIYPKGIEFIEEDQFKGSPYNPSDSFSKEEKIEIIKRLDEFGTKLNRLEKGQEITYNDLLKELEELRDLVWILGKKNWIEVMKGKLIDAGFGSLSNQVGEIIIEVFKDQDLLG